MLNPRLLASPWGAHHVSERKLFTTTIPRDQLFHICLTLLMIALILVTRPYKGVIHDSRFYTIQTLSALLPGRFSDDLYFKYGSADKFTLFTVLYAPLLATFGIAKASIVATIVGLTFWSASLFYLSKKIFHDSQIAFVTVAAVIILPGGVMFSYGEPFVTPRLFAESITLCALGTMLAGRKILAIVLFVFSATIHPIMTLPGIAVLFLYEATGRRVWWLIGGSAIAASIGMAAWGIQPFARLLKVFDPEWLAVIRVRDFLCFLGEWAFFDWLKLANIFVVAALGLWVANPSERKFFCCRWLGWRWRIGAELSGERSSEERSYCRCTAI